MKRRTFVAGLPILAASLPTMAEAAPNPGPQRRRATPLVVGESPPPIHASRLVGNDEVTLGGNAGRVMVLDFWATWCSACRSIMPALDHMYSQYRAQGLSLVGLSPESETAIRGLLRQHPVNYTIARDTGGTVQAYGVRGIPMIVPIDRAGKVRDVIVGVDASRMAALDRLVQRMLAEPV